MRPYAAGVDIGGTTIKMGLFASDGSELEKWEIPTRKENAGVQILPDLAASLREVLDRRGIPLSDLEGVGMGVPGGVLPDGTVNKCVNLGWDVVPAGEQLSALLDGTFVKVGNDADVAALGEMWKGGGRGCRDAVMVTLGTGVGGGIIHGGEILTGAHGAAGEIGHAHVEDNIKDPCNCGNYGCLEQVASATGIVRLARE